MIKEAIVNIFVMKINAYNVVKLLFDEYNSGYVTPINSWETELKDYISSNIHDKMNSCVIINIVLLSRHN